VVDALDMATAHRRPAPRLVHHSDQGSQLRGSGLYPTVAAGGIAASMGGVGTAHDNAAAESLFATIKHELVHRHRFPTRATARTATFEFIEVFYKRRRQHSSMAIRAQTRSRGGCEKSGWTLPLLSRTCPRERAKTSGRSSGGWSPDRAAHI
jgi:putative transposase